MRQEQHVTENNEKTAHVEDEGRRGARDGRKCGWIVMEQVNSGGGELNVKVSVKAEGVNSQGRWWRRQRGGKVGPRHETTAKILYD